MNIRDIAALTAVTCAFLLVGCTTENQRTYRDSQPSERREPYGEATAGFPERGYSEIDRNDRRDGGDYSYNDQRDAHRAEPYGESTAGYPERQGDRRASQYDNDASRRTSGMRSADRSGETRPFVVKDLRPVARQDVDRLIGSWHVAARDAARDMMAKYGPPNDASSSMLLWLNNGSWKCTHIANHPIPHGWPMQHVDVLEQGISYRVPPDMFDDLARFDGSIIAERTRGTLSARCQKEEANFLAINLAHDIITGRRTVEDARQELERQADMLKRGERSPLTTGFTFTPAMSDEGDPDREPGR